MAIRYSLVAYKKSAITEKTLREMLAVLAKDELNLGIENVFANLDFNLPLDSAPIEYAGALAASDMSSIMGSSQDKLNRWTLSIDNEYIIASYTIDNPNNPNSKFIGGFFNRKNDALTAIICQIRNMQITNGILDNATSIREDIPFYFIPNITLNWKTVLNPENYAEYWDREILLKAPAYEVTERENGWIEIQTYRDLFDPLSEESLGQIRKLACYLEKYHKKAKYSLAKRPQMYINEKESRPGCADCEYE